MKINNLKELWQQNDADPTLPKIQISKKRKLKEPLEKIRTNMQIEFYISFTLMILNSAILIKKIFNEPQNSTYHILLLYICWGISMYYYLKFIKFYKFLKEKQPATNFYLLNLSYSINQHLDLYKSYYVTWIPLHLLLSVADFEQLKQQFGYSNVLYFIMSCNILGLSFLYLFGKIWYSSLYRYHYNQIMYLVEELNEDEIIKWKKPTKYDQYFYLQNYKIKFIYYTLKNYIGKFFTIVLFLLFLCFIFGLSVFIITSFFIKK